MTERDRGARPAGATASSGPLQASVQFCRLCHEPKALCNSHILPEFLYRLAYDDKHRLAAISLGENGRVETIQKGWREPLLCDQCEQRLSIWERYASQVLFHDSERSATEVGDEVQVLGIDYSGFKLFGLSVLWRASVSSLPAFRGVQLGPHEESIRQMLLTGDAGAYHRYPCLIRLFPTQAREAVATVIPPYRDRVGAHICYKSLLGGLLFTWIVSSHTGPRAASRGVLREDGTLPLQISTPEAELAFFRRIAKRMPEAAFE